MKGHSNKAKTKLAEAFEEINCAVGEKLGQIVETIEKYGKKTTSGRDKTRFYIRAKKKKY